MSGRNLIGVLTTYQGDLIICAVLLAIAISIGVYNVSGSGQLWLDAAQYANAGAMIHDWLLSGEILHPYEFAKKNYAQYPAFHLPYHPPIYPGLLGVFFVAAGTSYFSARLFVALCLGVAGCFFYGILRVMGTGRVGAFACSTLLLTLPEIALWSRDTMSEIPALALILAGSFFFILWLQRGNLSYYLLAVGVAEMAFLSRVLTAGLLPAWLLWAFLAGRSRRFLSPSTFVPLLLYVGLNIAWVLFTLPFSKYETGFRAGDAELARRNYVGLFKGEVAAYYLFQLPNMVGYITLVAAVGSLMYTVGLDKNKRKLWFWLSWLFCYCLFILAVGKTGESRYFLYALPCFPGLIAYLFPCHDSQRTWAGAVIGSILIAAALVSNVNQIGRFPRGVVGSEVVGAKLAGLEKSGNILMSCGSEQANLIFRYRSYRPNLRRDIIRGDRTLVIRPPNYSGARAEIIARSSEQALDIIRRGRARYVVTCLPADPAFANIEEETILLQQLTQSQPDNFSPVAVLPLLVEYEKPGYVLQVFLWEYKGQLPEGPNELPVIIPTADLILKPASGNYLVSP